MADRYLRWSNSRSGRFLTRRLGLPRPVPLHRYSAQRPVLEGGPLLHLTPVPSRFGGADGARQLSAVLGGSGLPVRTRADGTTRYAAAVVDATGIRSAAELRGVHECLHPVVRSLVTCGRIVVLGALPEAGDHHQAAAQQALEGFVRSLGKETGGGRTVQLLRFAPGAPASAAGSTLRFLLSPKSAYVSGQVIDIAAPREGAPQEAAPQEGAPQEGPRQEDPRQGGAPREDAPAPDGSRREDRPLLGRTALVTGCARGIGASVAETLARDGAHVICLDVPQAAQETAHLAERIGGTALTLDITAEDAGGRIVGALPSEGLDILVHNAGITRDRKLANMAADRWDSVLGVNLEAVLRTTDQLLAAGALRRGTGRVIATASIAGIAGNAGQTNYAASKAGIIGLVRSLAPRAAAEHGVTVNAVAPGFIETRMTAAVPLLIREAGRRMNSHAQGGLPVDVAETTAWFADPSSSAVNGQVVRVCGQSLLGA